MAFNACNSLLRSQRNVCLKYSEKYYTKCIGFTNSKWFYQHGSMQRPRAETLMKHTAKKTKYKVPKTWRKALQMVKATNRNNPKARKKSTMYAALITFVIFGTIGGFVKFLHFFGPGGGGRAWREGVWNEVSNKETTKALEKMEQESSQGYIRNMFGLGTKPHMYTLEQRAKMISEERYRTWEDVMSKGFPTSAREYKRVSKMRPESLEEYEIMDRLQEQSEDGRKVTNAVQ
eukprot:619420_1